MGKYDNEVKGEGNQLDYGMRVYDPRLGKFLSVDPLGPKYPWNSTYAYAENNPVKYIDLDGLEKFDPAAKQPTGITHITKATLPSTFTIDQEHFIKIGNYRLHGVTSQDGKQWWLARRDVRGGYSDEYIVGTNAVGLFSKTRDKLAWASDWVEQSEASGGGLWGAYKSTWTPQNVVGGIMMGMGGLIAAGEAKAMSVTFDRGSRFTFAYHNEQSLGWYEFSAEKGLAFDLNIPENLQKKGFGATIFNDAMQSTKATKFTATWIESTDYPGGISANLKKFRELRAAGLSEQKAAWGTWSGGMAEANKFTNVTVRYLPNGVEATFTK